MLPVHAVLPETKNLNIKASKLPLDAKRTELQPYGLFRKFCPQNGKFPYAYVLLALFYLYEKKKFCSTNNGIRHSTLNVNCTANNLCLQYSQTKFSYQYSTMQRTLSWESCSMENKKTTFSKSEEFHFGNILKIH